MLVATMMLLVVLTLVALTGVRSSRVELIVSGNEKWQQDSFYRGEGALDASTLLLEMQLARVDVKKRSESWVEDAFWVGERDFDMWQIDDEKKGSIKDPAHPDNDSRSFADDFISPGGVLGASANVVVLPRSAIDTSRKIIGSPVSLVRFGLAESTATPGMNMEVAAGADVPAGTTRSRYRIWAQSHGKLESLTELEVQWFRIY